MKSKLSKLWLSIKLFIIESWIRLKCDVNPYWEKWKWIGGFIAATGVTFQADPHLSTIGGYMITAGTVLAAFTQLTARIAPTKEQIKDVAQKGA